MSSNPDSRRAEASAFSFNPVPVRARRDGWTPERQRAFIMALAECRCVRAACRHVGKSPEAAYELARRPGADGFRAAWERVFALPKPAKASTSAHEWQVSGLQASSTSECKVRPDSRQLPPGPPTSRPAYSFEAFVRMAAAARRRAEVDGGDLFFPQGSRTL